MVESLDGAHQAQIALLDQIWQRHSLSDVSFGDADDQAGVGPNEFLSGIFAHAHTPIQFFPFLGACPVSLEYVVCCPPALFQQCGEFDLFIRCEERYPAHFMKVESHGVGRRYVTQVKLDFRLDCLLL